jgi:hypothetical protein
VISLEDSFSCRQGVLSSQFILWAMGPDSPTPRLTSPHQQWQRESHFSANTAGHSWVCIISWGVSMLNGNALLQEHLPAFSGSVWSLRQHGR